VIIDNDTLWDVDAFLGGSIGSDARASLSQIAADRPGCVRAWEPRWAHGLESVESAGAGIVAWYVCMLAAARGEMRKF
jgi:hypothetical protein